VAGVTGRTRCKLNEAQVLAIFFADVRRVTVAQLAKRHGVSCDTVKMVRAGKRHRAMIARALASIEAGALPGDAEGVRLCYGCVQWSKALGCCLMGFPDVEEEGPAFAMDCNLYEASIQSINRA